MSKGPKKNIAKRRREVISHRAKRRKANEWQSIVKAYQSQVEALVQQRTLLVQQRQQLVDSASNLSTLLGFFIARDGGEVVMSRAGVEGLPQGAVNIDERDNGTVVFTFQELKEESDEPEGGGAPSPNQENQEVGAPALEEVRKL